MRYYDVTIESTTVDGGVSPLLPITYRSMDDNGRFIPTALQCDLDLPVNSFAAPAGLGVVKIRGVSFPDITQASYLVNRNVTVRGGMTKGLPLAKPAQAGVLYQGFVYQAFGNWQGTDVSLDLILAPVSGSAAVPVNLAGQWAKGQSLQSFIEQMLTQAYPGCTVSGTLSSNLTATQDYPVSFTDLPQFASWALRVSLTVNNQRNNAAATYLGVQITQRGNNTFYLFDGSMAPAPTAIGYTDLIGNGTWLGVNQVQFKVVMRADIAVGDLISLPANANLINIVNSFTQYRQGVSFKNSFLVVRVRHLGNSRQADADSWCTIIDAVLTDQQFSDEQAY